MAKYNREFLVPYLEDVCALHITDYFLAYKLYETQRQIIVFQHGEEIEPPEKPQLEKFWGFFTVLIAAIGAFEFLGGIFILLGRNSGELTSMQASFAPFLGIAACLAGGIMLLFVIVPAIETKRENDMLLEQYMEDQREYLREKKEIDRRNQEGREKIPELQCAMSKFESERKKIAGLLAKAYGANVIPSRYRDIYAAVYLYDYFKNSRADDLDMVLNTYVLEQIKDKLDEIIQNQAHEIMNQRAMLALQKRSIIAQQEYASFMKRKVCQIAASMEEQTQYLSMIESNAEVTAFFAAANYLR